MANTISVDGRLVFSGAATLQSAEAIHAQLLGKADQPVLEIDCGGVDEVDLSFVQLVVAARESARKAGRSVTLAQPASGVLREVLERSGFIGAGVDQPNSDQAFWLKETGLS